MSEMVERVAKAIWEESSGRQLTPAECEHLARAAIAAMRETTPGMIEAGENCLCYVMTDDAITTWHAMIDEALK